jgi:hypothetical protein
MAKKTMTPKQVEANRRNAQKSTGPKTPEGKEHSSRNAMKHRIFSSEVVVTSGPNPENIEEYEDLLQGMLDYWKPKGRPQEELVADMANSLWHKARIRRAVVGELMKAADAERHRLEREELDSVRRGEANSNNRTPKGMRLLKATVLDSIDELAASRALQDDVVEDLRKFLPADLAEDLLTANVTLKKLVGTEGPTIQNESRTLRDKMIEILKGLPLDEWQKSADERHAHAQMVGKLVNSIPSASASQNLLRYEIAYSRQFDRALKQLIALQSICKEEEERAVAAGSGSNR